MKKLRDYLIGAGLGLTGFICGCAPMTPDEQQKRDERLLMFVLGYGAIVEPDPQRAAAMGLTSKILRDYDVAREGKSQVIITGKAPAINNQEEISEEERDAVMDKISKKYGLGKYSEEEKKIREEDNERKKIKDRLWWLESSRRARSKDNGNKNIIFDGDIGYTVVALCNEWRDDNKDGIVNVDRENDILNYSTELKGIKRRLSVNEGITLIFDISASYKTDLSFKLLNENGTVIDFDEKNHYGFKKVYAPGSLKPGKYTAIFYSKFKAYENFPGEGNSYAKLEFECEN